MEQISKVITVEEHFMSEKVNGEYQKLLEKKNLTLAQKAKASLPYNSYNAVYSQLSQAPISYQIIQIPCILSFYNPA